MNESKEPVIITEHGRPLAYLVYVEDLELMQGRMQILEGIARGETAVIEKRIYSHARAKEKMRKWLK